MTPTASITAATIALAAALLTGPALADSKSHNHATPTTQATASPAPAAAELADGEVRKIDKDGAKLTLRHGEIKHLDMPGMTMVFQIQDAALLDKVKVGDKVRFRAEKAPSGYMVTAIEAAK